MGMNYKVLTSEINKMDKGERCYINAVNLSLNSIEVLRKAIREKRLLPDYEDLKRYIIPDAIEKYMSGECIAPQLTYIKQ